MVDNALLNPTRWNDRLAFDIALRLEGSGENIVDIMRHHQVTTEDLREFNTDKVFLKRVDSLRRDIRENGITFRMKAKAQAEELLLTSWALIHTPDVSAAVKADLIKSTVKWAGLEVKSDADPMVGEGNSGVRIVINMNGPEQQMPVVNGKVIDHEEAA